MGIWSKISSFFTGWLKADVQMSGLQQQPGAWGGNPWGGNPFGGDGSKWPGGMSNSGESQVLDHYSLRQNARSVYLESPLGKSIVNSYADTVVDKGLKLQAEPKSDILGITPEEAERWATETNEAFDLWAGSKKSHLAETLTFYQAQRLMVIYQQRDGEYFVRLNYSKRADLLNPLQIQFIDPNQIRGSEYTTTSGFQSTHDGIDRDLAGREKAYHVWVRDQKQNYKEVLVPRVGARSGRLFVIHGFMPELPGQGRGFSRIAHILQNLENQEDYALAVLKKCINQSNVVMFNKPSPNNDASDPFESIEQGGVVPVSEITAATDPATAAAAMVDPVQYQSIPEATLRVPGSVGVFNLREGEEIKPFMDSSPLPQYGDYIDSISSYLTASMGMPLEYVKKQFTESYSASRAAMLLVDRLRGIWENELDSDSLAPIYEMWLSGEIAAGRRSAPGWTDPRLRAAWMAHSWASPPMPNIDPMRTAKADKEYVSMGAQTLDRVARNHNGTSGKSNRAKLAREFEELPVPPWEKQTQQTGGPEDG